MVSSQNAFDFSRSIFQLALLTLGAVSLGCKGEMFPIVPITGKVTYDDGSLINAGMLQVQFVPTQEPVEGKFHPPQSGADVEVSTGEFKECRMRNGKLGVLKGKHKVLIISLSKDGFKKTFEVPKEYHSVETTPLTVDIEKKDQVVTLTVPKPKRR